jgi:hypothetical protein
MPRIPGRGVPSSVGSSTDSQRSNLSGKLGGANMQRGGIGLGRVEPGGTGGALDYEFVRLKLAAGVADYTVGHERGVVPGLVERVEHTSPGGAVYVINAIDRQKWTFSTVRVRVTAVAGAITAGDTILLRIGGEQAGG